MDTCQDLLPNEKFALECRARYEAMGLVVDERNGEFAHCPYPKGTGDTGYYLLHDDHQHQGLLQSKDVGRMCFFPADAKRWLDWLDFREDCPENYLELWDIYREFSSEHARKIFKQIHAEKDEQGKSKLAVKNGKKGGKIGGKKVHEEKDEQGRSLHALKSFGKIHEEKDEQGRSLHNVKLNEEKDERGKSIVAVKGGKKTASQIWESTVDGFRSGPGPVACHNKANGWDPAARIRIK